MISVCSSLYMWPPIVTVYVFSREGRLFFIENLLVQRLCDKPFHIGDITLFNPRNNPIVYYCRE